MAANGRISFFFMAELYSIVYIYIYIYIHTYIYIYIYIYYIFLIQSSVDEHLGCFHVLAIVNSAAMNIEVRVSFRISVFVFPRYMPRSGVAASYGNPILFF